MSWINLNWEHERLYADCFYCDCCDNHNYYESYYWSGKDGWNQTKAILCSECYQYIGTNCEFCRPSDQN